MAHPFWSLKPWWCQPWTILLTGTIGIAGSWLLLQIWWLTTGVALVVIAWWVLFLLIVPNITPVETIVK
ncbi:MULTISPECIES: DUF6737 family protein [unclassified Synechococcus]|uniref:DUF6737 family protein n=1 Tax=unclassified Synechococcus TaxID=2626047 RepID=UPI0020CDEB7C|nr:MULTISPECIES: DUF6737 family protein [unclassified Synechococcus]MCX5928560.1 hypothetical protein [Synechococcus sp. LacPavin_0920_WC12_MAG_50_7]